MFHPSQLEKKFGGTADNLDVYWPPQEVSKEYGVDPSKINRPSNEFDSELSFDEGDCSIPALDREGSNILKEQIRFKNKLNPIQCKPVRIDSIIVETDDSPVKGKAMIK